MTNQILKTYIKSNMFHLPREQRKLEEEIKNIFYSSGNKVFKKKGFEKLYSIEKTDNSNVTLKRNTNIFLLNLYLLVLQETNQLNQLTFDKPVSHDNNTIKDEIFKITGINVLEMDYEEIEKTLLDHLYPKKERNRETKKSETLEKVEFNLSWIKKANEYLN